MTRHVVTTAHPLGLREHPAWPEVRDRWNALYCASIMPEARPPGRRVPILFIMVTAAQIVGCSLFLAGVFAVLEALS